MLEKLTSWILSRAIFSHDTEELSLLELVGKIANKTNETIDVVNAKTDNTGDHKGTWQGLTPIQTEQGSQAMLDSINKKTSNIVSVLDFGADPTGALDSTTAFKNAIAYCSNNKKNLLIPDGDFLITGPLPFPNYFVVMGNGYRSNIVVDLPEGEFVFKDLAEFKYSWGIENIRFSLKAGALNKNVGAIGIEKSLRGAYVRNIWAYELRKPFYFGASIWGILSLENIFAYLLSENLPPTVTNPAIHVKGNTVMMSNIEIIGGFNRGLFLENVSVFKLHGFNISGAGATVQILEPLYLSGASNGEITGGWIEQLVDNTTAANGRTVYTNGTGLAIYVLNSKTVRIGEVNISSGAIYIDGSTAEVKNVSYSQSNAGLRVKNNGKAYSHMGAIKYQNIGADANLADGEIRVEEAGNFPQGLTTNPTMKAGAHALTATNGSLVTLTDELVDFVSSTRAIKATITASNQGVNINASGLIVGNVYTAVAKVKKVIGLDEVSIKAGTGVSTSTVYPATLKRSNVDAYHLISYPFTATAATVAVKITGVLSAGSTSGIYLIDSADILKGYNNFDVSLYN